LIKDIYSSFAEQQLVKNMATRPIRPTGVTVLSILAGLLGVLVLVVGIIAVAASALISQIIEYYAPLTAIPAAIIAGIIAIAGVIAIIVGALYLVVAYGLWIGAGWAWWLTLILSILGIIGGLLSLPSGIVLLIIYALIIWYFWQPYVKAYFGQAPARAVPPSPPPV